MDCIVLLVNAIAYFFCILKFFYVFKKKLLDFEGAVPGDKFTFTCDTSRAGWGEAKFDVVFRGRSLPHTVQEADRGLFYITFTPQERGKHRIYVYYNGIEVKGTKHIIFLSIHLPVTIFHFKK